MIGAFNAANALAVLGVLLASDVPLDAALRGARAGRGRRPAACSGWAATALPLVVVDYAHSPDALEKVLTALRPAGSPPRASSPACSAAAATATRASGPRWARSPRSSPTALVVTSDNPRSEDPAAIAAAVVQRHPGHRRTGAGASSSTARARSRGAIAGARPGDVVLIAGKGHEDYQERDGVRHPFSDARVAAAALAAWSGA